MQYVFDEPVITYVHPIALMKSRASSHRRQTLDQLYSFRRRASACCCDQGRIPATVTSIR